MSQVVKAKELSCIDIAMRYVQLRQEDKNEWSGPCPRCGGTDRFHVNTEKNRWFCRTETGTKWQDAIALYGLIQFGEWNLHGDQFKQAVEGLLAEKFDNRPIIVPEKKVLKLSDIPLEDLVNELHRRLNEEAKVWWALQGIEPEWQEYWRLGFHPDKVFKDGDKFIHSRAYSIPYSDAGNRDKIINLQWRLDDQAHRYRWHGVGYSSFFTALPGIKSDQVFVLEGAKKAMVFTEYLSQGKQVYAIPSKDDLERCGLEETLKNADMIWFVLDPDATQQSREYALRYGKKARSVSMPTKVDDAILKGWLSKVAFSNMLRYAR